MKVLEETRVLQMGEDATRSKDVIRGEDAARSVKVLQGG